MLAWLAVRLRYLLVAAWLAGAAAATLFLPPLGAAGGEPLSGLVPEHAEAIAARTESARRFRVPLLSETAVVQRSPGGLTPAAQLRVAERAAAVNRGRAGPALQGIAFALPLTNTAGLFPGFRERSTTAITWLFFAPGTSLGTQAALGDAYLRAIPPHDAPVGVTGAAPARLAEFDAIDGGLPWITGATVALIALLLGVTYRSLVAPLVTLSAAGIAYLVAVRAIAWVGQELGVSIPSDVEPLIVVLLLGITTDYSIFLLSGMRDRLRAGEPRLAAAQVALERNGPIVLTAGLIVAAGTASLLAGRLGFFRAFGPGMALSALIGLAAALTLIPALLATLGRAAFWPGSAAVPEPAPPRGLLGRALARRAVAVVVAVAVLAGLVAAGSLVRRATLGYTLIQGLPADDPARRAADAAGKGFAPGIVAPTELILERGGIAAEQRQLARLQALLARQPGVAGVVGAAQLPRVERARGLVLSHDGGAARFALVLSDPAFGGPAIETLRRLQDRMPALLAQAGLSGARVLYGGDTALAEETVDSTVEDVKRIGAAALAVNLVLLVLFLRSLIAPVFLLASSVLALAATLGLTELLFQQTLGHAELTYYVPFAAAVLLVSLGSDYNVFLAGRIRDEATRRDLRNAIAVAVPAASRTITTAGLALAASFALLALVPLRAFRELAFALAAGVVLDALLVRSLLVPALISLFGRTSWWPGRLSRRRAAPPGAEHDEPAKGLPAPIERP